jgi:hypothetical protein
VNLCLGCGSTLPWDAEAYGIEYCEQCAGIKTYTENDVREMMSKIALDFYKFGQANAEIVDLNASVEIYLKQYERE